MWLDVSSTGGGEPLVLVHGSWDHKGSWALLVEDLSERFQVVTYDRRGHGESQDGAGPGLRRDDEDDLERLLTTLGLEHANVVTNSFGGSIALGLATRRPGLFRTLCAHEPPLMTLAGHDAAAAEARMAFGTVSELIERGEPEAAARRFAEHVLGPGSWEMMRVRDRASMSAHAETFAEEQSDPDWAEIDLDALSSIDFPVLLTRGDRSPAFFSKIISVLTEAIDGARSAALPSAGHLPHLTRPSEYAAILRRFVAA